MAQRLTGLRLFAVAENFAWRRILDGLAKLDSQRGDVRITAFHQRQRIWVIQQGEKKMLQPDDSAGPSRGNRVCAPHSVGEIS